MLICLNSTSQTRIEDLEPDLSESSSDSEDDSFNEPTPSPFAFMLLRREELNNRLTEYPNAQNEYNVSFHNAIQAPWELYQNSMNTLEANRRLGNQDNPHLLQECTTAFLTIIKNEKELTATYNNFLDEKKIT